jgi:hypothetical protein
MLRPIACLMVLASLAAGCSESYHPVQRSVAGAALADEGGDGDGHVDVARRTGFHGGSFQSVAEMAAGVHECGASGCPTHAARPDDEPFTGCPHSGEDSGGATRSIGSSHGGSVCGAAAAAQAQPYEGAADGAVTFGTLRLAAPEGWVRQQPRSQFVLAEFALPKAEGDAQDGRLTLSLAGGSVDANVQRWQDQLGSQREKDSRSEVEIAGLTVTLVDLSGTYNDQPGPYAPSVSREGYRILGAIIPVKGDLHFIKAYGPQKTMAEHETAFHAFVKSVQQ